MGHECDLDGVGECFSSSLNKVSCFSPSVATVSQPCLCLLFRPFSVMH